METREITFTQFLMPDGRQKSVTINRPTEIAKLAEEIIARGYRFECEMLTTREISLTITNKHGDADIEIVNNGPEVPAAIDQLITRFSSKIRKAA